jgi:uncharacterized membrane protein
MTTTAIILILISAFAHTGWNMIGKSRAPTPEFLLLANTLGCLSLTPVLFKYGHVLGLFPTSVWLLLIVTGGFQALYYTGVAKAYSCGDMSIIYPVMRSAPVLFVLAVNLVIGKISEVSAISIMGIGLIVFGGFLLPLEPGRKWDWKRFVQRSTLLAIMAAVGTCGYSMIDDRALRILGTMIGHADRTGGTLVYGLMEGISASFWLAICVFASAKGRAVLRRHLKSEWKPALLAGVGIYSAYCLVLVAMTFARNVSYIVAFRQLGIPLAAVLGIVGLKEPSYPAKLVGIAVMLVGLVMVTVK